MLVLLFFLALASDLAFASGSAEAQGLPAFAPVNPVAASRSALSFEPYHDPLPGGWHAALSLDYASAIESNALPRANYDLDSEILRLRFAVHRDLSPRFFLLGSAEFGGAYAGFLDGFIDWYHGLLGIDVPERDRRPHDAFLYAVTLPRGIAVRRRSSPLFFGDLRLGGGIRLGGLVQSAVVVSLPTLTGPEGYGKDVVAVGLLNTIRTPLSDRLVYEGSVELGYTPSHGSLGAWQHETIAAASSGLRLRFWGRQSLFANLFYHSPYYHDTTLPALDRRELSLDFGWILATRAGPEWRLGMTEDLEPAGPGVDLIFRLGASF